MMAFAGPSSHHYFSHRLKLHYADWGNAAKPTAILVHGGYDHCRSWDWVANELRADYHVVAPDLRGHGDSDWSVGGYHLVDYVFDLGQLVRRLGGGPVTIISHSLGGYVSLLYAGLFPDRVSRLVAIDPFAPASNVPLEDQPDRIIETLETMNGLAFRVPRRYQAFEEACARMQQQYPNLTHEQARHLTEHGTNVNEDGSYTWKFDNYLRAWRLQVLDGRCREQVWARISCPTLFIHGSECTLVDAQSIGALDCIRTATMTTIQDAGHWLHHDKLAEFMAIVQRFLVAS